MIVRRKLKSRDRKLSGANEEEKINPSSFKANSTPREDDINRLLSSSSESRNAEVGPRNALNIPMTTAREMSSKNKFLESIRAAKSERNPFSATVLLKVPFYHMYVSFRNRTWRRSSSLIMSGRFVL